MVVTVNPEFLVAAAKDAEFYRILSQAKYVIPDGRGIQLAGEYLFICQMTQKWPRWLRMGVNLIIGLGLGGWDLVGGLKYRVFPQRMTGVELMLRLAEKAEKQRKIMMLVGGRPVGLVEEAGKKLKMVFPDLKLVYDPGHVQMGQQDSRFRQDEARLIKKIDRCRPSYLMLAYGAPKQEKWLFGHQELLVKTGVEIVMGVGGAFAYIARSEVGGGRLELGIARHEWWNRLKRDPAGRFIRIIKAVIVFPWLVYKESLLPSDSLTNFGRLTKLITRWSRYETSQFV